MVGRCARVSWQANMLVCLLQSPLDGTFGLELKAKADDHHHALFYIYYQLERLHRCGGDDNPPTGCGPG